MFREIAFGRNVPQFFFESSESDLLFQLFTRFEFDVSGPGELNQKGIRAAR